MTSAPGPSAARSGIEFIEGLLHRQMARIRQRFLVHGLGWVLAAFAALVVAYYVVDRTLELPTGVRALLSLAALGWLGYSVFQRIVRPQGHRFAEQDVAVALERRFPELQERLVTAHQLGTRLDDPAALHGESPAMVRQVVAQAVEEASRIPARKLLDTERTARLWGLGSTLTLLAVVGLAVDPAAARAFGLRVLGLDESYPRQTNLVVELPESNPDHRIEYPERGRALVTLAAGADLPVLVRADGVVPREVSLRIEGGRGLPPQVAMTPRREDPTQFRYVFRRIRDGLAFHAEGNDDPRGDLEVEVRVVQPPRVGRIETLVTMPSYTRAEPRRSEGGGLEALEGSTVRIAVEPTATVTSATLRFLESDRSVELEPEGVADDSGRPERFVGDFVVDASDRYQVELIGRNELRNPDPGTYPVVALQDLAPAGTILLPDDASAVNYFLPTASLPLRVRATDDFGLRSIVVQLIGGRGENEQTLELLADPDAGPPVQERIATQLVRLDEVLKPNPGESLTIDVRVTDVRDPAPQETDLPDRPVYVVDATELARRIASHFRQIREDVEKTLELQTDRSERLEAVLEEVRAGTALQDLGTALAQIEVGQGRIQGSAQRLHREFMRAFDAQLFNNVEESIHAQRVLELYSTWHAENPTDAANAPGFYRAVAEARATGRIGAMEKTLDPMLDMVLRGDRLAGELGPKGVELMEIAGILDERTALVARLEETSTVQSAITAELRALLGQLDEWNELQDVISMARAIRNAQTDLRTRTESLQKGR